MEEEKQMRRMKKTKNVEPVTGAPRGKAISAESLFGNKQTQVLIYIYIEKN
jgi:hypothetical protein